MNDPVAPVSVVAALPAAHDRQSLREIFSHTRWNLRFSTNVAETRLLIRTCPTAVIISDRRLPDGHWEDVLDDLDDLDGQPSRPSMIVACTHDDARLWADVLSLGAQDVLVKPFQEHQVLRAISSAWRQWSQRDRAVHHHAPAMAR